MKIKLFTLIVGCKNENGILNKIAKVLVKHKLNISSIYSTEFDEEDEAKIVLEIYSTDSYLTKVVEEIRGIHEVINVFVLQGNNILKKKLGLFKISTDVIMNSSSLCSLIKNSQAEIIDIKLDFTIIQLASSDQKISELYTLLNPYGIKEFSKSGDALINLD